MPRPIPGSGKEYVVQPPLFEQALVTGLVLLVAGAVVGLLVWFALASEACGDRHGTLVEGVWGQPVCVEAR